MFRFNPCAHKTHTILSFNADLLMASRLQHVCLCLFFSLSSVCHHCFRLGGNKHLLMAVLKDLLNLKSTVGELAELALLLLDVSHLVDAQGDRV